MIHGEAKMLRRRAALACPDVKTLLLLVQQATGAPRGAQTRLAEIVGCSKDSLKNWAKGLRRPSPALAAKLVEAEAKLRARVASQEHEAVPARAEKALPLMANMVSVRVEGEQALVSFALKVPGEGVTRRVIEVLVPKAMLRSIVADVAR